MTQKSDTSLDDVFPPSRVECLLEAIIDQNEEIIALLKATAKHTAPEKKIVKSVK